MGMFVLVLSFSHSRKFLFDFLFYDPYMIVLYITTVIDQFLKMILLSKVIGDGRHNRFPILYGYFETYLLISYTAKGLFLAAYRIIMNLLLLLAVMVRPDISPYPVLKSLDIYFNSYVSTLHCDHRHNNPLVRVFSLLVMDYIEVKRLYASNACCNFTDTHTHMYPHT
eukprot:GHVR01048329.1.p1 GENE.GHVR01048329.1~~GHVR01048329.1.p1  ORF type:complete len:168 (+),score=23.72 GHVR01048329.1:256-759(+)